MVGLASLVLCVGVFWVLNATGVFRRLQRGSVGHVVAGGLTIAATCAGAFIYRNWMGAGGDTLQNDEWILVSLSIGLLSAIVSWALIFCPSPRLLDELKQHVFEGYGPVLLSAVTLFGVLGLGGSFFVDDPGAILGSATETFSVGKTPYLLEVPPGDPEKQGEFIRQEVKYKSDRVTEVQIRSNKGIIIGDAATIADLQVEPYEVLANDTVVWQKGQPGSTPIPLYSGASVFIQNTEFEPATVELTIVSAPNVPEANVIVIAAASVLGVGLLFLLMQAAAPKVSAVAMATAKSEIVQPVFLFLVTLGACLIVLFTFMSFYTLGEDIKLLKDCGITIILIIALLQGVWSASSSVSDEIEGRTALTVLSKPIDRRSFMLGKMIGVFWIILLIFVILGGIELFAVAYKPIYDARESSNEQPLWQICHIEAARTIPGLVMAFFHSVVLSTFSVAISTRLSQFANFALCLSVYIIGHLTAAITKVTEDGFAIPQFISQLIAVLIPNLDHFSMQSAIDVGKPIPIAYLSGSLIYCVLYTGLAVFLGLLLFEDRDLA